MASLFDPNSAAGSIVLQMVAAAVIAGGAVVCGWLFGPVRWWRDGRRIRKMILSGRYFRFVYRPGENKSKIVTFEADGRVGEGRNSNENTWRTHRGRLEIFAQDGGIYSRFMFDSVSGNLVHTNDPDCGRSAFGQYFEPQYKPWPKDTQTRTNGFS
jgi:hypothetical protein